MWPHNFILSKVHSTNKDKEKCRLYLILILLDKIITISFPFINKYLTWPMVDDLNSRHSTVGVCVVHSMGGGCCYYLYSIVY